MTNLLSTFFSWRFRKSRKSVKNWFARVIVWSKTHNLKFSNTSLINCLFSSAMSLLTRHHSFLKTTSNWNFNLGIISRYYAFTKRNIMSSWPLKHLHFSNIQVFKSICGSILCSDLLNWKRLTLRIRVFCVTLSSMSYVIVLPLPVHMKYFVQDFKNSRTI